MDVDIRDQGAETLFVTEKLAFSVSTALITEEIEEEVAELCRLLAIIRDRTNWVVVRDLLTEIDGSLQVYDDHTRRTL